MVKRTAASVEAEQGAAQGRIDEADRVMELLATREAEAEAAMMAAKAALDKAREDKDAGKDVLAAATTLRSAVAVVSALRSLRVAYAQDYTKRAQAEMADLRLRLEAGGRPRFARIH